MFKNLIQLFRHTTKSSKTDSERPIVGEQAIIEDSFFGINQKFEKFREDELIQQRGNGVYLEMLDDDQIMAAIDLINNAIIARNFFFDVEEPEEQQKIADFFEHNLTRTLKGNLKQLIVFMLSARVEGYSIVEKIFAPIEMDGKTFWGLDSYSLVPPDTITFEVDKFGNTIKLLQTIAGQQLNLTQQKFIHTIHKPEFNRQFGRSALKPAYRHYWAKLNLYKFWNIFSEKVGGGFLISTIDGALDVTQQTNLRNVTENLQTCTAITTPKGVTFEYILPRENKTFSEHISNRNAAILRSLLVPTLMGFGEETTSGSQARAKVQFDIWLILLDQISTWIADILNEQLFKELSVWNFGTDNFPLFKFDELTKEQKTKFAEQWVNVVKDGIAQNTFEDEARIRDILHMPQREEDVEEEIITEEGPEDAIIVPDGSNPLQTAKSGLRSALDNRQKIKRADVTQSQLEFEHRVDFQRVKEIIYQDRAFEYGLVLFAGTDAIYKQLSLEMSDSQTEQSIETLQVNTELQADLEKDTFTELSKAFNEGRQAAGEAFNIARQDQGLEPINITPLVKLNEIPLSFLGREIVKQEFGLDAETAEEFINLQALQSISKLSEDVLQEIRQAMINGLVSGQDVISMVENATRALEPLIGKRDASGVVILDIDAGELPARIATIVNTTLTKAYNEGLRSFFEDPAQENFVQAYQYSAILDDRTTDFCRNAHGRIWPVDSNLWQKYLPPNHFNCRSLIIPVVVGDVWTTSPDLPTATTTRQGQRAGEQLKPNPGFEG